MHQHFLAPGRISDDLFNNNHSIYNQLFFKQIFRSSQKLLMCVKHNLQSMKNIRAG